MISKPLLEIELADLRGLLGKVREGKTIEYKQVMPVKTDREVIQFLAAATRRETGSGQSNHLAPESADNTTCITDLPS